MVRAVAALVVVVTVAAVAAGDRWAPVVLGALSWDFAVRGFGSPRHSPLALLGRVAVDALGIAPKPVDAAPKRFAARIGIAFSAGSAILFALGANGTALAVVGVLVACALLEAGFAFCVGCRVYSLLPTRVARALAR